MYLLIGIEGLCYYTGNDIIEEPDAVVPHVRICMGRLGNWAFYHDCSREMEA